MIDDGMNFTVSTIRTPASLIEPLREIRLKLPVIAMDGAVLYDIKTHEYLRVYVISAETSQRLMGLIEQAGLSIQQLCEKTIARAGGSDIFYAA